MQGPPSNNFYGNNPAPGGMNSGGAAGSNNRWSVSSSFRQSITSNGSRMTAQVNSMNQRDSRPIKDKSYQRGVVNELVNYLNQSGYQHNVTTKTLTQPTNKDFQEIFKYLYHKLEPEFDFQKKPEDEVPALLKTMRYDGFTS